MFAKLTNISDLTFWVKLPRLFFHALEHERNRFIIYENISSFSLIYGFRNGLVFCLCFSKLLTLRQSKNWFNIWQYLAVLEVSVVPKVLGILALVSFKTSTANYTVTVEHQLGYTCWLVRFGSNFNNLSRF